MLRRVRPMDLDLDPETHRVVTQRAPSQDAKAERPRDCSGPNTQEQKIGLLKQRHVETDKRDIKSLKQSRRNWAGHLARNKPGGRGTKRETGRQRETDA